MARNIDGKEITRVVLNANEETIITYSGSEHDLDVFNFGDSSKVGDVFLRWDGVPLALNDLNSEKLLPMMGSEIDRSVGTKEIRVITAQAGAEVQLKSKRRG